MWYRPIEKYDQQAVAKHLKGALLVLSAARDALAALTTWSPAEIDGALRQVAEAQGVGVGKVAQPMRVAITGTQVSPSIDYTVFLAGRDQALRRIDAALPMCSE